MSSPGLTLEKQAIAEQNDIPFHDYGVELEPGQVETLNERAHFRVYFGPHSTNPADSTAALQVLEGARPDTHLVTIESFRYSPAQNDIKWRNGRPDSPIVARQREVAATAVAASVQHIEHGERTPINSFALVVRYCMANRIPFVKTDFDQVDDAAWARKAVTEGAQSLPNLHAATRHFLAYEAPALNFDAAVQRHDEIIHNANDHVDGEHLVTYYRWGAMADARDTTMANTIAHTTLEQLDYHETDDKLEVLSFCGLEHEGGVLERFKNMGVEVEAYTMDSHGNFKPAPRLSRNEYRAYRFAADYFLFECGGTERLGMTKSQLSLALREIPVAELSALYETHRSELTEILALGGVELNERTDAAASKLKDELVDTWRKAQAR